MTKRKRGLIIALICLCATLILILSPNFFAGLFLFFWIIYRNLSHFYVLFGPHKNLSDVRTLSFMMFVGFILSPAFSVGYTNPILMKMAGLLIIACVLDRAISYLIDIYYIEHPKDSKHVLESWKNKLAT